MMQAKRRSYHAPAARAVAVEALPSRFWGVAMVAACAASWAAVFGAAKLLFAVL
ncbi:MAG TPA: hypothetical protein VGP48_01330 [Stellaceae bacterium]|jgi:hypothetical protein|nr:hypothetical protein [Stellaceae bacterium]